VLDRLLEDPRIEIEGITGASAGAMNAVALAAGYHAGDREEARESLRCFWNGVLEEARTSPLRRSPIEAMLGGWGLDASPAVCDVRSRDAAGEPIRSQPATISIR
jgi:NTE family protein